MYKRNRKSEPSYGLHHLRQVATTLPEPVFEAFMQKKRQQGKNTSEFARELIMKGMMCD